MSTLRSAHTSSLMKSVISSATALLFLILPAAAAEGGTQPADVQGSLGKFFTDGVHHVLTGYDHLLFAAALVLSLRSFWEVFKVIGVFTIAHSITVTLTALNVISAPASIVEPIIAASIVAVALQNVFWPKSSTGGQRLLLAFIFGLVHGMGLAGALKEAMEGLSPSLIGWAIAAFCVGVEIGHLIVIAPLSGILKIGRDAAGERFHNGALRWGSIAVALIGLYYLTQRVDKFYLGNRIFAAEAEEA